MSVKRFLCVFALLFAGPGLADTLLLDSIDANTRSSSLRPSSGADMDSVEADFGMPTERFQPVGDPPITRWEYPGFVVYFEHDRVIHSVIRR